MNLYVVDYWVPFPASEYGGLYVIAAENEEQVKQICIDETFECDLDNCDFDDLKIKMIGTTELYTEPHVVEFSIT
jgi:hypothetical protein